MRPLSNLILTLFIALSSNAQTIAAAEVAPYGYDSTLKGGYTISLMVDDSLQYLYLKKGSKIITELASTTRGLPYNNLGYVGADFTAYFVLVHSYGSGNPRYIELIKKSTGRNVSKKGAAWIDVDEQQEFLLYSDNDVPQPTDKMTLYNIRTGEKQFFSFPTDIFDEPQILNRIHLGKLTNKQLIIQYDTANGTKTNVYSR